jgi:hydrogenase maturation protease
LIHHCRVDEQGLITWPNLIIATNHNNLAMNRGILQVARQFVRPEQLTEGMLNRVEAVIRAFDACLSCSTHVDGHIPLHIQLVAPGGHIIDETRRPPMIRILILACGNSVRGDDAGALELARLLRDQFAGPQITVHAAQQWTPELAEPLSRCDLAIFLDVPACFSPGFVHCEFIRPLAGEPRTLLTHSCTPSLLLRLSQNLYHRVPARAFLLTIDAQSFAFSYSLSAPVQRAIPEALSRIYSIFEGATHPPSVHHALSAD